MHLAIFDIDGTLTRASRGFDDYYVNAVRAHVGEIEMDTDWSVYPHATDDSIVGTLVERHLGEPRLDVIDRIKDHYFESLRRADVLVQEIQGAAAALNHLLDHPEWALAVATGNWTESGRLKLESAGLGPHRFPVRGADRMTSREDVMRAARGDAEAHYGRTFERVVYLGDAAWDVHATRNLGWPFVGIGTRAEALRDLGTTHVLPDLSDLAALLAAMREAGAPAQP